VATENEGLDYVLVGVDILNRRRDRCDYSMNLVEPRDRLRGQVLISLPLRRGSTLVVHSEQLCREPPLDRAANRRAATPTVGIATAFAVARIVDTLEHAPAHGDKSRRLRREWGRSLAAGQAPDLLDGLRMRLAGQRGVPR
jgi:hypothetical protein